jgi:hypothetical protein
MFLLHATDRRFIGSELDAGGQDGITIFAPAQGAIQ